MRSLVLSLFFALSTIGCDRWQTVSYDSSPSVDAGVPKGADKPLNTVVIPVSKVDDRYTAVKSAPTVVIKNSTITINKRLVWMGGELSQWKSALGGSPRCIEKKSSLTVCIWDDFGIEVGTDADQREKIKFLNIHFATAEAIEGFAPSNYSATGLFGGHLELDGFAITRITEFRSIRENAAAGRDLRCGGRDCSNPSGGFSDGASLYMQLNSQSDSGKLLGFSIACTVTKDCIDLIPK